MNDFLCQPRRPRNGHLNAAKWCMSAFLWRGTLLAMWTFSAKPPAETKMRKNLPRYLLSITMADAGMVRRLKSIWNLSRVFWLHAGCFSHPHATSSSSRRRQRETETPKIDSVEQSFCVGQDLKNNTDDTTACNLIPWLGKKKSGSIVVAH